MKTAGSSDRISVDRIDVGLTYLEALLTLDVAVPKRTSDVPMLRERALGLLPGLRRHTCENDASLPFSAELADTETAHLVEHVTVELMALAGSSRSLRAETRWDFAADGVGRYRLRIAYDDDLVAIAALKEAIALVTWLVCGRGACPSPEDIAARLRKLRRR